jgi:hypothetical protein
MHHWIPGLFHPLNPVTVLVKTNSDVLCGDITLRVITITMKKTKCPIPPMTSSDGRIFLAKMLQKRGSRMTAHARRVPCQRSGT